MITFIYGKKIQIFLQFCSFASDVTSKTRANSAKLSAFSDLATPIYLKILQQSEPRDKNIFLLPSVIDAPALVINHCYLLLSPTETPRTSVFGSTQGNRTYRSGMVFTSKGNITVIGKGFSCIEILYLLITSCNKVDTSGWRRTGCDGRTSRSYELNRDWKLAIFLSISLIFPGIRDAKSTTNNNSFQFKTENWSTPDIGSVVVRYFRIDLRCGLFRRLVRLPQSIESHYHSLTTQS